MVSLRSLDTKVAKTTGGPRERGYGPNQEMTCEEKDTARACWKMGGIASNEVSQSCSLQMKL